MWSSHPGDDDDDESDQAAVSALAAFQYGAQQEMDSAGYGAVDMQEQYRRQQAMMAYQHGHPHGYNDMDYSRQFGTHRDVEDTRAWENQHNNLAEDEEEEEEEESDVEAVNENAASEEVGAGVEEDEEEDEDMDDDEEEEGPAAAEGQANVVVPVVRGKPEAMAKALASKGLHKHMEELEMDSQSESGQGDDNEDMDAPVKTALDAAKKPVKKPKKKIPSRKPKSSDSLGPSMDDAVPDITSNEYENLEALMVQFCRVPLLAEFSRPVTLLHPELMPIYSKIVSHPVDLGLVCRSIGRKGYKNTREVQLHMWRMFANCVKYHSHPNNKDAVPSFVSIALHLRDYFNALWEEFMIPSDPPPPPEKGKESPHMASRRAAFTKREENRKKRLNVSSLTPISVKCLQKTSELLQKFIETGLCVDGLDQTSFKLGDMTHGADERDLRVVMNNLNQLRDKLTEIIASSQEYTVEQFETEIKNCCDFSLFENKPSIRVGIVYRIDRLLGQLIVPINEANCRGVTQSSVWGCMAAVIWARESSKKPYWPALVLGILAPEDQREDWHNALTERNEVRLPEKLRTQLTGGKRRAEQALHKQSQGMADPQSYFLVEFLGTHEFIWVRESDIVEDFDPKDDPNQREPSGSKKKRSGRANFSSVIGSKQYVSAIEEANWALEEFELQLQDPCGDMVDDEAEEGEDMNYSYSVLCLSDEEAEETEKAHDDGDMTLSDLEEANELLATQGLLDFSATGRKNAKKRTLAMKKQKLDAEKKEKAEAAKKAKAEAKAEQSKKKKDTKKKEIEEKREQLALEKRRKKRLRNREKALRTELKKTKKRRTDPVQEAASKAGSENLMFDKRGRATAIVKAYLSRMTNKEDYKNLSLNGIMTIPAAMVDSSGLLGMSLAFRAAAGVLSMPDDEEDLDTKNKPWELINADRPKTSAARVVRLEKQAELLEKEIKRLKKATAFRREKCEEAKLKLREMDKQTDKNDKISRQNHYKKKKKYSRGGAASRPAAVEASPEKSEATGMDDDDDLNEDDDAGDAEHVYSAEVVPEEIGAEEQSDVDNEDGRSYASEDVEPNDMDDAEGMYE